MAADYATLKAGGFMRQKQKDMFSMRLRVVGGTVTVQQLKAIAEAAEKFGHNYVHLTSRQGVEIPFIRLEEIDDPGGIYHREVRLQRVSLGIFVHFLFNHDHRDQK